MLPDSIQPEYLSEVLRRCATLGAGRVSSIAVQDSRNTVLSAVARLRLDYEGAADGAPRSLILKTRLPRALQTGWNAGRQEVAFYRQVAPASPAGLVPRCFDAVASEDGSTWHLLLEDLADTHAIATAWPLPPGDAECTRIVRARARLHAAWWDHPALGRSVGEWASPEDLGALLTRFEQAFAGFTQRTADLVTAERRTLYERLLAAAPRLNARYESRRHMTIVHGDAHVWNCFLAREGDGVKLFDWDAWRVDVGTDDLAYMMAMHWYPDRRRSCESRLLDRYHETLLAEGVTGYDRGALDADYRLSVLWLIMRPVWQAAVDLPPSIWWNNYERIMMAVDDLDCRELL